MLTKIISGGQTGADQGFLEGARRVGIATGGTAPLLYRTEKGVEPDLLKGYGLLEGKEWGYTARTIQNVKDADATCWIGTTLYKGGYRTTRDACMNLWGRVAFNDHWIENPTPEELTRFLSDFKVSVLNGAGNRESGNLGIFQKTVDLVVAAFGKGDE